MSGSLREVFTPLFSYVLLWLDSPARREQTASQLRNDIKRLLDEQIELIKRLDLSTSRYQAARFAAVAWADEIVVRRVHDDNPELAQQWKRSPLQVELFNTANAGEEFYENLQRLPLDHTDVREIYYLCLSLGFRGRYYDETHDVKLDQLRRDLARTLASPPEDLLTLEKREEPVTPQPYEVAAAGPRRHGSGLSPAYLLLPLALLIAGALFYLLPDGRTREEILADLQQRLKPLTCSDIRIADFNFDDGTLVLEGRVPDEDARKQVRAATASIPEIKEMRDKLILVPRPFCRVVELLEPVRARVAQKGQRVEIAPQKGCNTTYRRGESLVFGISGNQPLGYVYADYFVADRENVAHLMPSTTLRSNRFEHETEVALGTPDSEARWEVEAPFGTELITVITSSKPLFEGARRDVESDNAYLVSLEQILARQDIEIRAGYCFISTQE